MKTIPDRRGLAYNVSILCIIIAITLTIFLPSQYQQLIFMLPVLGILPIIVCLLCKKGNLFIALPEKRQRTRWYLPALMQLIFIGIFALIDQIFQATPANKGLLPVLEAVNNAHLLTWIPASMGIAVMGFFLHTQQKKVGIGSLHAINLHEHAKDSTLFSNLFNSSSFPTLVALLVTLVILKIFLLIPHTALGNRGQLIAIAGALLPILVFALIPRIRHKLLNLSKAPFLLFVWAIPLMAAWLIVCYFSIEYFYIDSTASVIKHGIFIDANLLFFLKAIVSLMLCVPTIYIITKQCAGMSIRSLLIACLWLPLLTLLFFFTPVMHSLTALNTYPVAKVVWSAFGLLAGLSAVLVLTQRWVIQACLYAALNPEKSEKFRRINRLLFTLFLSIGVTLLFLTSTLAWVYPIVIAIRFWPLIILNTALPYCGFLLTTKKQTNVL